MICAVYVLSWICLLSFYQHGHSIQLSKSVFAILSNVASDMGENINCSAVFTLGNIQHIVTFYSLLITGNVKKIPTINKQLNTLFVYRIYSINTVIHLHFKRTEYLLYE